MRLDRGVLHRYASRAQRVGPITVQYRTIHAVQVAKGAVPNVACRKEFILTSYSPWVHRHIYTKPDIGDRPLRQLDWLEPR